MIEHNIVREGEVELALELARIFDEGFPTIPHQHYVASDAPDHKSENKSNLFSHGGGQVPATGSGCPADFAFQMSSMKNCNQGARARSGT